MTQPIPESVLRETVEVCKRHQAGLNIGCWEDFKQRAADPSHGVEAMAERLIEVEAALREAPHAYTCDMQFAPCTPACEECTVACLYHPNAVDKKCDCWKSRIGEA